MNFSVRKLFFTEFSFWILVAIIGVYFLYPLRESIRFGSDLVGGTYLMLQVHVEKAVDAELVGAMQALESHLKKSNGLRPISKQVEKAVLTFTFDSIQNAQDAARIIKEQDPRLIQKVEGATVKLHFADVLARQIKKDAVERNIDVLRRRLDRFSVAEIPIAAQGDDRIVVELPDVADPQKAKEMIGRAANLDFRLVYDVGTKSEDILYRYEGELPADRELLPGKERGIGTEYYLVERFPQVTGRMLKDARPAFGGRTGIEPIVHFSFTAEGGEKFYNLTSKHFGRRLAIVLDGEVISAPEIKAAIRDSGEISGNFTADSARTLSALLKSGSFVAPVTFEEERQIGPGLGEDSRHRGLVACLIGLALLLVFSVYYYRLSGFFAFCALIFNLIMVLLGLAWLRATLTLPGIAGMVLTIGMAIDASILIFERIKELLAAGLATKKAVKEGFSGAMKVILDANITTFIVGIVLYHFGTGPVQGFAVTMMLGIVATLITGLFFLRSLFMFVIDTFQIRKLSI